MRKAVGFFALFGLAGISVALATRPKPMNCDAWECKGSHCSPAKYVAVRNAPILKTFQASPVYEAALLEGSAALSGLAVFAVTSRRRRSIAAAEPRARAAEGQ